jgi:hypothetical protein
MEMINSKPLEFKRTGKITMRCEPYLIIKYPRSRYMALYGPQTNRMTIGIYPDAKTAQEACEAHRKKNTANG